MPNTRPSMIDACTPEQRFIMAMLAAPGAGHIWGEPAALATAVSWDGFMSVADGMLKPYLHWASRQAPFAALVPASVQEQLGLARHATRIKNLRWASELRQIVATFRSEGISLIVVKGAVLQRTVYPDPSTRPMSDVDVVVRREQMALVHEVLARLGFHSRTTPEAHIPGEGLAPDEEGYFIKPFGDWALLLEVHTRLEMHSGYQLPNWDRCAEVRGSDGLLVPALDAHSALRHICFHLAKHGFEHGLMWLLDVRLFVERNQASIDWDVFIEQCEPSARPLLGFTLGLAADWLGADVPERLRAALPLGETNLAAPLVWGQMWDYGRAAPPLNAVTLVLSGDPRRIWTYLRDRGRRWTAPMSGRGSHPLVLMAKRVGADFKFFRARVRDGGFGLASIRAARQSDRRFEQLRAILWPPPKK